MISEQLYTEKKAFRPSMTGVLHQQNAAREDLLLQLQQTKSEVTEWHDNTQSEVSTLITKGRVSSELLEKLNVVYPFESAGKLWEFMNSTGSISRRDPVCSGCIASTMIVNQDYSVVLPNGYVQADETFNPCEFNTRRHNKDLKQCDALTSAFSAAIPGIETLLNKKLWGEHQVNISVILYYPESGENWSGSWHQDGKYTKITSIVYFHHEEVSATLSFRLPTVDKRSNESLASISTQAGDVVTFANEVLEHRVHGVSTTKKASLRGLVTFFYHGPHGIPASLKEKPIIAETVTEEDNADELVNTVWRFSTA